LVVSRDFYRRAPETLEHIMRAYVEGVAVLATRLKRNEH
jgi:hypothetical protein